MSEHIDIEAIGLPPGSVSELPPPSILENERPVFKHVQKTWTGKTTAITLYKHGLIKTRPPGRNKNPVLIRAGLLQKEPKTGYHVPHIFVMLSLLATIASGVLFYLSIFNEWMFSFCLILALALIITQTTYRISFITQGGSTELFNLETWFIHRKQVDKVSKYICNLIPKCTLYGAGLPVQVQEHRRLFNEGLISAQNYEMAKGRLFTRKN